MEPNENYIEILHMLVLSGDDVKRGRAGDPRRTGTEKRWTKTGIFLFQVFSFDFQEEQIEV